jgi:hypothetical protein
MFAHKRAGYSPLGMDGYQQYPQEGFDGQLDEW